LTRYIVSAVIIIVGLFLMAYACSIVDDEIYDVTVPDDGQYEPTQYDNSEPPTTVVVQYETLPETGGVNIG
jgi:hypothetical protein